MTALTDRQRMVLEFERQAVRLPRDGRRDDVIRRLFGWTPTRHAVVVNQLLDNPAALAYDATTVNRLRRLRDQARAYRATGSAGKATRPDVRGVRPMLPMPQNLPAGGRA